MPKTIKYMIGCFTTLAILSAIFWGVLAPLKAKAEYLEKQVKIQETQLIKIKQKVRTLPELESGLRNARNRELAANQSIPTRLVLSETYARVDSLAKQSGFKVKKIIVENNAIFFNEVPHLKYVPVNVEGIAYFPQVIDFFDRLSKSSHDLQVEKFDLNIINRGNKPQLSFKITLNAFEYSSDAI